MNSAPAPGAFAGALLIGILQSRSVQDHLIDKFGLRRIYRDRSWEDARRDLEKHSEISQDGSGIITVRVRDGNPSRAAAMAQDYVEEMNLLAIRLTASSARRERLFLEQRLAEVRQDLEAKEKESSSFASNHLAIDPGAQDSGMIAAAGDAQGKLIAAQAELQSLKSIYGDGSLQVRAAQARTRELQQQMAALIGESRPEEPVSGVAWTDFPSMRRLPVLGTGYADLHRSVQMEEALFATLTQQYEAAKLAEARDTPGVQLLDPPQVPEKKYWPPRLWIVLLSSLASFSLGVCWILGAAWWAGVSPGHPWKLFAIEIFHDMATDCRFSLVPIPLRKSKEAALVR